MFERRFTDEQIIEALREHGSNCAAARALGTSESTVRSRAQRLARKGWSPKHGWTHTVPDGFKVKGVSSLYGRNGQLVGQWVKSSEDAERQRALFESMAAGFSDQIPRQAPLLAPESANADLLNLYVLTDYHLGMLAWGEETGADWDIQIAEDLMVKWFAAAIAMSPNATTGVFAQLGDFMHWDGMDAVTPASKHLLDADTRFQKLVRVAIRVIRRVIDLLLRKHDRVVVLMAEGNHDTASSIWLREWLHALYENEPRVEVERRPDPYYCIEFGANALFFHHGHKRKPQAVDTVFAAKFREIFGRTKFAYAHLGHLHSVDVKETNLMLVEQHRTLAAPDAYASRGGWMSGRDAKVITYHREFGRYGEVVLSSKLVERRGHA